MLQSTYLHLGASCLFLPYFLLQTCCNQLIVTPSRSYPTSHTWVRVYLSAQLHSLFSKPLQSHCTHTYCKIHTHTHKYFFQPPKLAYHDLAAGMSGTRFSPGTASITLPLRDMDSSTFTQSGASTTSNGTHRMAIHVWNTTSLKWLEKNNTNAYNASATVQTASFSAYAVMLIPLYTSIPRTANANEELYSIQFIVVRYFRCLSCTCTAILLLFCWWL
jgi:hypothetical protein